MNDTTDFAIGDHVEDLDPRAPKRFGKIVEIAAERVRVEWAPHASAYRSRRTWLSRKGFGKRWALVPTLAISPDRVDAF